MHSTAVSKWITIQFSWITEHCSRCLLHWWDDGIQILAEVHKIRNKKLFWSQSGLREVTEPVVFIETLHSSTTCVFIHSGTAIGQARVPFNSVSKGFLVKTLSYKKKFLTHKSAVRVHANQTNGIVPRLLVLKQRQKSRRKWPITKLCCKWFFFSSINVKPFFVIQSEMWKEWKENNCQPNFWNEVCLNKMS